MIDQTLLPEVCRFIMIRTPEAMWDAIRRLVVRGAPAIGCAAAYGVVLGIRRLRTSADSAAIVREAKKVAAYLATSRPTAVNLFWALDRMTAAAQRSASLPPARLRAALLAEAHAIFEEDKVCCREIGRHGAALVPRTRTPFGILTHCNAGGLATADYGTALAVVYAAVEAGRKVRVFSDETRPLLQGSRLTAWELSRAGVPVTTICDNMAAQVMREGRIGLVVVGADRIAANGDAANKIGTYGVAILARHHRIPFYVAAPTSTFDLTLPTGDRIPIEQREGDEIRRGFGRLTAPRKVEVYNPAFDVTPAELITGIITERGLIRKPDRRRVAAHFRRGA